MLTYAINIIIRIQAQRDTSIQVQVKFLFIRNFQFKVVLVFNKSCEYFADCNCAISLLGCHNAQQSDI